MDKVREKRLKLKTVSPDEYIRFLIKISREGERERFANKLKKLFKKG